MDLDWKKVVGSVAPVLATALGGPFAGTAVHFLSKNLLHRDDGTAEDIEDLVQGASTDTLLRIKELDQKFKLEMEKIGVSKEQMQIEYYKIDAADRDSARNREVSTGSRLNSILAVLVILGFFVTVGYVLSGNLEMSAATATIVGTLIGYVSAKADQVISYYFGGNHPGNLMNSAKSLTPGFITSAITDTKSKVVSQLTSK